VATQCRFSCDSPDALLRKDARVAISMQGDRHVRIRTSTVPPHASEGHPGRNATTGAGAFVYHGSLAVARSIERDFTAAEKYLRGDSIMSRTFDHLEHARSTTFVTGNAHDDDHYNFAMKTVAWDPHSALQTTSGGRQSPALGLGHELVHADESPTIRAHLDATYDPAYDNREERRVILGAETHAARTLGEGTRHDHGGRVYHVNSPTVLA